MKNMMDLLQSQLSDGLIEQLAGQIGGNKQQTATAAQGAMAALVGAMSRNAQSADGVSALMGALDRDHDGSILEDLAGFIGGSKQAAPQQASMFNGAGILKHVLGGKQSNVIDMISQMSGLDQNGSTNLLIKMAPMVMGMLGKMKKEQNMDSSGLQGLLRQSAQSSQKALPKQDLLSSILDRDGDGQVADDVASMGMSFLSKLFRKRR